jgi:hypothetical protein
MLRGVTLGEFAGAGKRQGHGASPYETYEIVGRLYRRQKVK